MPFVIEEIPPEVVCIGMLSRYRAYQDRQIPFSRKWVVDVDRNARMAIVSRVGGASGPNDGTNETDGFVLFWDGRVIDLKADPLPKSFPPSGPEMNWRIHPLTLPNDLQERQKEVRELIRDAFCAFNGDRFVVVNIRFD